VTSRGDLIVVLRHALAGEKLADPDDDFVRGLDDTGRATAGALVHVLPEHVMPVELVSSPYFRCTETVQPLAEHLELPIKTRAELRPAAGREEVMELLLAAHDRTLVCTHGEVITRVFDGLSCEKGAAWILRRRAGVLEPVLYVHQPGSPLAVAVGERSA
jgi:phosphohistidine phosphatase SixA